MQESSVQTTTPVRSAPGFGHAKRVLDGIQFSKPLPAGFDPLRATREELQSYGLPHRTTDTPGQEAAWVELLSKIRDAELVTTRLEVHPSGTVTDEATGNVEAGTYTGKNWAGAVVHNSESSTGGIREVTIQATWDTPNPAPGKDDGTSKAWYSSTWVGIDGFTGPDAKAHNTNLDVVACGTGHDVFKNNGDISRDIYAWVQWYPASAQLIDFKVSAGDRVTCRLSTQPDTTQFHETADNSITTCYVTMYNETKNTYTSFTIAAERGTYLRGDSVEWIVEDARDPLPEANFGSVEFEQCWARVGDKYVDLRDARPVASTCSDGTVCTAIIEDPETLLVAYDGKTLCFSVLPGEIIRPGQDIYIYSTEQIGSSQGAVTVLRDGKEFDINPTEEHWHNAIRVTTQALPPGTYNLVVNELLSHDNRSKDSDSEDTTIHRLNDYYLVIPFTVPPDDLPTVNSRDLRVAHVVKSAADESDSSGSDTVRTVRLIHRKTGEVHDMIFGQDGKELDLESARSDLKSRRPAGFGPSARIHGDLWSHLGSIPSGESKRSVDIVVWPQMREVLIGYDKRRETPQAVRDARQRVLDSKGGIEDEIQRLGGQVTWSPPGLPFIQATIPASKVSELAKLDDVGGVFFDDKTAVLNLTNSMAISNACAAVDEEGNASTLGSGGSGVNVAVYEKGPRNTKNLVFEGRYTADPAPSSHARLTSAIIKNCEGGHLRGFAPSCSLYSANADERQALVWAVCDNSCTVVSQSFTRGCEQKDSRKGQLSLEDIVKDYMTTQLPFPTIVHAAGNLPSWYVHHIGYNTLTVGNHDDSAMGMSGSSTWGNPVTPYGDRELPELCANGTAVAANGQLGSGTSMAAPAVAGVAALLQSANTDLQMWPEACRAILMASANRNVVGGTWWGDVAAGIDGKAGAGALDARAACAIAVAPVPSGSAPPPSPMGWDADTMDDSCFTTSNVADLDYVVSVPAANVATTSTTQVSTASTTAFVVKVALAWDSSIQSDDDHPTASVLDWDLNIVVMNSNGDIVCWSCSFDNSYEVVEFYAQPGVLYTIRIVRARWSSTPTWFGIAWTVTEKPWLLRRP